MYKKIRSLIKAINQPAGVAAVLALLVRTQVALSLAAAQAFAESSAPADLDPSVAALLAAQPAVQRPVTLRCCDLFTRTA